MRNLRSGPVRSLAFALFVCLASIGQPRSSDSAQEKTPPAGAQAAPGPEEQAYPSLVDITASTGIKFEHLSSPEQKFIVTK